MAKHKFKPGNSLGGRKPLSADVKAARNMSYEQAIQTIIKIRSLTKADVKDLDPSTITLAEAAIFKAYQTCDYRAIKDYEDRIWGKAKESVELSGDSSNPLSFKIEILPVTIQNNAITSTREDITAIPE